MRLLLILALCGACGRIDYEPKVIGVNGLDLGSYADDLESACGGAGAGDVAVRYDTLEGGLYRFSLEASFPAIFYEIPGADCAGAVIQCQVGSGFIEHTMTAGTSTIIVIDSGGVCGGFQLRHEWLPSG